MCDNVRACMFVRISGFFISSVSPSINGFLKKTLESMSKRRVKKHSTESNPETQTQTLKDRIVVTYEYAYIRSFT